MAENYRMPAISTSGAVDSFIGLNLKAQISKFLFDDVRAEEERARIPYLFSERKAEDDEAEAIGGGTGLPFMEEIAEMDLAPESGIKQLTPKILTRREWGLQTTLSQRFYTNRKVAKIRNAWTNLTPSYYGARGFLAEEMYAAAVAGRSSFKNGAYAHDVTTRDGVTLFSQSHVDLEGNLRVNQFANELDARGLQTVSGAMNNFQGYTQLQPGIYNKLDIAPDTIVVFNREGLLRAIDACTTLRYVNQGEKSWCYNFGAYNIVKLRYGEELLAKYGITDTAPWLLLDTAAMKRAESALILDFEAFNIQIVEEKKNRSVQHIAHAAFNAGFVDWQFAAVGGVAAGATLDAPVQIAVNVNVVNAADFPAGGE
ncbi:hypothetical protein FACS1894202_00830 [Clostridia bacterium]|nr:hypothetical protein FACS1894202_00830 [Clostridia bacterium]